MFANQYSVGCAGLIIQKLIEDHLPANAPERPSLLRRAQEMKLPENPLVTFLLSACSIAESKSQWCASGRSILHMK